MKVFLLIAALLVAGGYSKPKAKPPVAPSFVITDAVNNECPCGAACPCKAKKLDTTITPAFITEATYKPAEAPAKAPEQCGPNGCPPAAKGDAHGSPVRRVLSRDGDGPVRRVFRRGGGLFRGRLRGGCGAGGCG